MRKVIKIKDINTLEETDAYMLYPQLKGRKNNAEKSLSNINVAMMNAKFIEAVENIVEEHGDPNLQSYFTDQMLRGDLDLSDLKPEEILRKIIFPN